MNDDDREELMRFGNEVLELLRLYELAHGSLDRAALPRLHEQTELVRMLALSAILPPTLPFVRGGTL